MAGAPETFGQNDNRGFYGTQNELPEGGGSFSLDRNSFNNNSLSEKPE